MISALAEEYHLYMMFMIRAYATLGLEGVVVVVCLMTQGPEIQVEEMTPIRLARPLQGFLLLSISLSLCDPGPGRRRQNPFLL
jgi:hypothetical protein